MGILERKMGVCLREIYVGEQIETLGIVCVNNWKLGFVCVSNLYILLANLIRS